MAVQSFAQSHLSTLESPSINVPDRSTLRAPTHNNKAQSLGIYRDSISASTYKLIPPKYLCPISLQPMTGRPLNACLIIVKESPSLSPLYISYGQVLQQSIRKPPATVGPVFLLSGGSPEDVKSSTPIYDFDYINRWIEKGEHKYDVCDPALVTALPRFASRHFSCHALCYMNGPQGREWK